MHIRGSKIRERLLALEQEGHFLVAECDGHYRPIQEATVEYPVPRADELPLILKPKLDLKGAPMRPLANATVIVVSLSMLAMLSEGQEATKTLPDEQPVPVYKLEFHQGKPIPGIAASNVIQSPAECAADRTLFIGEMIGPGYTEQAVASLDPNGGHEFSMRSVPNLNDVHEVGFFPSGSMLAILATARASGGGQRDPSSRYILLFDRDGSYKSAVELPSGQFIYWQAAVLSSGNFLLLGYDEENRAAGIKLFSSNGQFLRAIDLPGQMQRDSELKPAEASDPVATAKKMGSVSGWRFAPVRQAVVLYEPESISPVLEVQGNGETREIEIARPKGYILNSVLPGADRWIVRFQREEISMSNGHGADSKPSSGNFVLYQVDPRDGSLTMRLNEDDSNNVFEIACEADGELEAVSLTKDSRFAVSTADLPR